LHGISFLKGIRRGAALQLLLQGLSGRRDYRELSGADVVQVRLMGTDGSALCDNLLRCPDGDQPRGGFAPDVGHRLGDLGLGDGRLGERGSGIEWVGGGDAILTQA
jgi:hypothetical protein